MGTSGENRQIALVAGADLDSGGQFKAIAVGGTIAAANTTAIGILQNKPKNGEHAAVAYDGVMKAYVGGAVTAGGALKVTTSGYLVAVASGDGAVAKAIAAGNSGSIVEVLANFNNTLTTY